jgi:hypothetical protein
MDEVLVAWQIQAVAVAEVKVIPAYPLITAVEAVQVSL